MKNIFENAYFGKPYKTRDGRKAIFQTTYPLQKDPPKTIYLFFTEDSSFYVNKDGKMEFKIDGDVFDLPEWHSECDIVSEWNKKINEKELDKLALNFTPIELHSKGYSLFELMRLSFKAGYRKAMESKK